MAGPFDRLPERYDAWFDSPEGGAIFQAEVDCVRRLMPRPAGEWLEVGVGTGRFAASLGVRDGVDSSAEMLERAGARGIRPCLGRGENLPYRGASFRGVLLVVTICFLDDPRRALHECARVLKREGRLVAGLVPADSAWGESYMRKGREGHPFYSEARFYTCEQIVRMASEAGFLFEEAASCLSTPPEMPVQTPCPPERGVVEGAGFVAMRFVLAKNGE